MRRKDHDDMNPTISRYRRTIGVLDASKLLVRALIFSALLSFCVSATLAQVYGVARKTTVVSGPHGTAAVSKTAVASPSGVATVNRTAVVSGPNGTAAVSKTAVVSAGGMPHGYIAVLPGGYRAVTVSGARYYTVGGIYYRPQMYQGRTVYVAVRL
jgi:hypothetical protein